MRFHRTVQNTDWNLEVGSYVALKCVKLLFI